MLIPQGLQSPYLNQEEAAAFINKAASTFRAYVRKYKIPRKGPGRNRYHIDDLRRFMDAPFCFIIPPRGDKPRNNAPFKPIEL